MTMDRSGAHEKSTSPDAAIGESLDAANTGQCEPGCGSDRSQPLPVTAPTWAEARKAEALAHMAWRLSESPAEHEATCNAYLAARRASDLALVRETLARLAKEARDEDRYPGRFPFLTAQEMEQYDPAAVLAALEQEGR